ncbi:hypothetical protein ACHQM5_024573 [Ranunculus cassubicifolius]
MVQYYHFNPTCGFHGYIMLTKEGKLISRVHYIDSPIELSGLDICDIKAADKFDLSGLPHFLLNPAFNDNHQKREWGTFTNFLMMHNRVARVLYEKYTFYILPPDQGTDFIDAIVFYQPRKEKSGDQYILLDGILETSTVCTDFQNLDPLKSVDTLRPKKSEESGESTRGCSKSRDPKQRSANHTSGRTSSQTRGNIYVSESKEGISCKVNDGSEKHFLQADPGYLNTLGQTHSEWIFGAVAELVDNSRDANATKLNIFIQHLKKDNKEIPVLSIIDDGHGMSHQDIVKMLSLGHKAPGKDDPSRIGRFGVGFKTGSMRIGGDAIVLTQTTTSRSIAFLSQSLNEGKDMLEIPIVSYRREGPMMEFDTRVHTRAAAEYNFQIIKKFSHFNEYYIGGLFPSNGSGTQIYIWNLNEWGSGHCLEWEDGNETSKDGDILIRSRRNRRRPGQISQKVPLDYSLRSYLEVIFLDPRMKIYVQGSVVKTRPLARSLNKTAIIKGSIMGKSVQLTLGRSQLEWEQMNCGIFLYWHGRLIEAYKRVGGMIHNADMGRGVIGVIDVTDLMNDGKHVWVHNGKQGFQDCEAYAKLEEWLGQRADEYWDKNFDKIRVKKGNANYKPDQEWVQCEKCRKWRVLSSGYDSRNLPVEWFCYMPPFSGKCETPEEQLDRGVIVVGAKRTGFDRHKDGGAEENAKRAFEGK